YGEAISALQEAIRLKPDFADAYNTLGSALFKAQQFDQAIAVYKKTLALTPTDAETHNNLGLAYFKAKRYPDAVTSFQTAIRLKQAYTEAHLNLAITYVALGDKQAVVDEYRILLSLDRKVASEFYQRFVKK